MKRFWYWLTHIVIKHLIKHFNKDKNGEIAISVVFDGDLKIKEFKVI